MINATYLTNCDQREGSSGRDSYPGTSNVDSLLSRYTMPSYVIISVSTDVVYSFKRYV